MPGVRGWGIALVVAAAMIGPAPTWAVAAERPRICIAAVRGDPDGAVAAALARALCTANACIPPPRVRRAGKLDFGAVRAEGVGAVLFGTVASPRRGRRLELALLTTSLRPERTWLVPLDATGHLAGEALGRVALDLERFLSARPARTLRPTAPTAASVAAAPAARPAGGADAEVAAAPPPPRAEPSAATRTGTAVPPAAPARRAPATAPGGPEDAGEPAADGEGSAGAPARVALDLGIDLAQRRLSYSGGVAPRTYTAAAIWSPAARLELAPLAAWVGRWYAGATAFAAYARSVGLETDAPAGAGPAHATDVARLELGAGLWFRPVPSSAALLRVRASYRWLSIRVRSAGGSGIDALPDADLAGPSVGLDLDAPLGRRWGLLGGLGYTRWLRARDLVGAAAFYPDGSAWALDASAGVSLALRGAYSARLLVDWERTQYALSGATAFTASGAVDGYLGFRAVLRAAF